MDATSWELVDLPGVQVAAAFPFEVPVVRELLHHLKYGGLHGVAQTLAKVAMGRGRAELDGLLADGPVVLVPVPLSKQRKITRGYNQAEELALALGAELGLPVWGTALRRMAAESQVGKGVKERQEIAQQFSWWGKDAAKWRNHTWVLVDDVCTTGATLQACAGVMEKYGEKGVKALVIARVH